MAESDQFRVRRVCFGYGSDALDAAARPEDFVAGFRGERSPMLWVCGEDGGGPPTYRSPNLFDNSDPAWRLREPDRQWWALAEVDGFPVPGPTPRVRLAWSVPTPTTTARVMLGFGDGQDPIWEEFPQPLAKELANQSHSYIRDMDEKEAYPRFLDGLHNVLLQHRPKAARPDATPHAQPWLPPRWITRKTELPHSEWLSVFDKRHAAALDHSVSQVKKYVARQRPFRDRKQQQIRRDIRVTKTARVASFSGLTALASVAVVGAKDSFNHGFPEFGTAALVSALAACVVSLGSLFHFEDRLCSLRGRLTKSLGLPAQSGLSDNPAVLRRAGYPSPKRDLTQAQHTSTAVSQRLQPGN
ncbi:MAG: hypothetical protein DLM55_11750 [Acidimicrobiales bacterium]|nr:MAG: hypothetical protein DLM55_11750 [Acidimicrobiales bacterium]